MQAARDFELTDLRARRDQSLLARFVPLYEQIFSDPKQRENPKLWPPRLWAVPPEPEPLLHVLLARSARDEILGGAVCEYYRASSCGLLTYLLVAEQARGTGIGRVLTRAALSALRADAEQCSAALRAMFAEAEDPRATEDIERRAYRVARLGLLAKLGAALVDVRFVQPDLGDGAGRERGLVLLTLTGATHAPIPGPVLGAFMHEFYRSLGVGAPEEDADYRVMAQRFGADVAVRGLSELGS